MSNKDAASKITEAMGILREAESMIDHDPYRKNERVIHLLRFIGSRIARRLDPELPESDVYPWQRPA